MGDWVGKSMFFDENWANKWSDLAKEKLREETSKKLNSF